MVKPIGFLGVGTIATAMIGGLRRQWPDLPIHLSPRSEAASKALAAADPLIRRAPTNAATIEASATVVLTMLPRQLDAVLRDIRFRPDQIVVSCVAGTPLDQIAPLVAPARVCRLVPLPMIARREGPLVLYPALPEMRELFLGLGDLIEAPDEATFAAYVAGSAAMSTILALQETMAEWIARRGAPAEGASTYVRSLFRALCETAMRADASDVPGLVERHETPGGLNVRVRRHLERGGWFDALGAAFEEIGTLRRTDLDHDDLGSNRSKVMDVIDSSLDRA